MSSSNIHTLDHLKIHPEESYAEVIEQCIGFWTEEEEVSPEERAGIEHAEAEYQTGKTYTLMK